MGLGAISPSTLVAEELRGVFDENATADGEPSC
jgi:hypothetical protein